MTRDELARLYTWVRTLELMNARVITELGQGKFAAAESSVMKLALARILTKASELGLRLIGPEALAREGPWQNQFLGAPALHIAGGTDEVQKNVAAERVLGLPASRGGTRTCRSRICRGADGALAHRIGSSCFA